MSSIIAISSPRHPPNKYTNIKKYFVYSSVINNIGINPTIIPDIKTIKY